MQQPPSGVWALGYVFGAFGAEAVPGPCLVDLLHQLGIAEPAVRTMLSRMTRSGQLVSRRHGRVAVYRLAGSYRERFLRIRHADEPVTWSGSFELIMYDIDEAHRRDRDGLRERAAAAGFGAARPGMLIGLADPQSWCRPWLDRGDLFVRTGRLACTPEVAAELADRAWDLSGSAAALRRYVSRTEKLAARFAEAPTGPHEAFLRFSEVMRDYTRLHRNTPPLPTRITPADWPGRAVGPALGAVSAVLGPVVREHVYAVAEAHRLSHLVEPLAEDDRPDGPSPTDPD